MAIPLCEWTRFALPYVIKKLRSDLRTIRDATARNVGREYLSQALSDQWSDDNRVHVRAFGTDRLAQENAPDCISYGLKFRNATEFADGRVIDWPLAWSARVWSWLHEKQNGLQPLSVKSLSGYIPRSLLRTS